MSPLYSLYWAIITAAAKHTRPIVTWTECGRHEFVTREATAQCVECGNKPQNNAFTARNATIMFFNIAIYLIKYFTSSASRKR